MNCDTKSFDVQKGHEVLRNWHVSGKSCCEHYIETII